MRNRVGFIVSLAVALACAGCATERGRRAPATGATTPASGTTRPAADAAPPAAKSDAHLTLDEIPGRPELSSATRPTSLPAARPPLDAIKLYAQAMDALQTGRRFTAINQLERALQLDPGSFDVNYALGRAHETGRSHDEQAVAAFERAAAIRPDHLELQTNLGRQYLARGEDGEALRHLRLAVQSSEYRADGPGAAAADLFLARALQERGYDRAALEQYARLLRRVQGRAASVRSDPHLAFLITNQLYVDIGDLYARNGMHADALAAYEPVAAREPADFDIQARVVRVLTGLQRYADAAARARELVVRFRASRESIELLREVHRPGDDGRGPADELAAAYVKRPGDSVLLFALVEMLKDEGRWAEAEGRLAARAAAAPEDFEVIRRWVHLRLARRDAAGAARLLVETLSERPDLASEIDDLWADVIDPGRPGHFRRAQLEAMEVLQAQTAAKEASVAAVARHVKRMALVDPALERATRAPPPFAPAYRQRMARLWQRAGLDDAQRARLADELIASAAAVPALAQELTGLSLLYAKQDKAAVEALADAVEMTEAGPPAALAPPALLHGYAIALQGAGDAAKFEQVMWKLLSDRPNFQDGYSTLYSHYSESGSEAQRDRVLNTWLVAVPYSTSARLLQAAGHFRAGRTDAAETLLARLLRDRAGDPMVLSTAYAFYTRAGHSGELVSLLEERVREQPGNVAAVGVLVELYDDTGRPADAVRVVDAARAAVADDPDQLYQVAHLYGSPDHRATTEATLRQVLTLEPTHPPASNDLGYSWAERGENLAEAERLIRQAVAAEPDNESFLDSMGWVLYKRGKFAEARPHLERAAGDGTSADAVVLDHLGDVLYRLGERDAAARQWDRAAAMLAEGTPPGRDDLARLKVDLERKASELKAGGPVNVSPVAEESAKQAKRP